MPRLVLTNASDQELSLETQKRTGQKKTLNDVRAFTSHLFHNTHNTLYFPTSLCGVLVFANGAVNDTAVFGVFSVIFRSGHVALLTFMAR